MHIIIILECERFVLIFICLKVGAASTGYQMTIGGYSANFTYDAFQDYNGYTFATSDVNNKQATGGTNCAQMTQGAWWYGTDCSCGACFAQAGQSNFVWTHGFSSLPLSSETMTLVCI